MVGLGDDARDVLVTHVLDAEPDHRLLFPDPSIWPFLTAIASTGLFIWSIFTPWGVVYGAVPSSSRWWMVLARQGIRPASWKRGSKPAN